MDEVAEAAADAALAAVEPAAGFAEVGHGRELAVDGAGGVPAAVEGVAGFLGRVFVFEARVDVADEVCWRAGLGVGGGVGGGGGGKSAFVRFRS